MHKSGCRVGWGRVYLCMCTGPSSLQWRWFRKGCTGLIECLPFHISALPVRKNRYVPTAIEVLLEAAVVARKNSRASQLPRRGESFPLLLVSGQRHFSR